MMACSWWQRVVWMQILCIAQTNCTALALQAGFPELRHLVVCTCEMPPADLFTAVMEGCPKLEQLVGDSERIYRLDIDMQFLLRQRMPWLDIDMLWLRQLTWLRQRMPRWYCTPKKSACACNMLTSLLVILLEIARLSHTAMILDSGIALLDSGFWNRSSHADMILDLVLPLCFFS